jgi:hypothetical protein
MFRRIGGVPLHDSKILALGKASMKVIHTAGVGIQNGEGGAFGKKPADVSETCADLQDSGSDEALDHLEGRAVVVDRERHRLQPPETGRVPVELPGVPLGSFARARQFGLPRAGEGPLGAKKRSSNSTRPFTWTLA